MLALTAPPRVVDTLSSRERQVLRLIANGLANKQIGRVLGISERPVKVHAGNVFAGPGHSALTAAVAAVSGQVSGRACPRLDSNQWPTA